MEKTKITLLRENLLKAVTIANRFVPLKPSLPVLGNVLLKVQKGSLSVCATNLETSAKIDIPAKEERLWEITVPAKILNEFLATTTGREVTLSVEKEGVLIRTENAQGSISGIAASEFPKLPQVGGGEKIDFNQKELQEAVNGVAFAASVDEGKPVLTGILLKNDGDKTIVVATDGYRLGQKQLKTKYSLEETLVGAKTLVEVLKIASELEEDKIWLSVSEENNQVIFSGDNFLISGRLLAGTYPNFSQIIPSKFETNLEINKTALMTAIKSAAVFAQDVGNVVKLEINPKGEIKISANTLQIGEGEATVSATVKGNSLKIAFNSRYILDGLSALKNEVVELNFSGVLSPALLRDKDDTSFIHIVMPVKAQN